MEVLDQRPLLCSIRMAKTPDKCQIDCQYELEGMIVLPRRPASEESRVSSQTLEYNQ